MLLRTIFLLATLSFLAACDKNEDEPKPVPEPTLPDLFGTYRDHPHPDSADCVVLLQPTPDTAFDFFVQYFPFMWPFPQIKGHFSTGSLYIPPYSYSGNISSPGGSDRLYEADIQGTGTVIISGTDTLIRWTIDYDKTGFLPESFHDTLRMYKCQ